MAPVALPISTQTSLPLGEYLFKRIESLGIQSIFGVPGDFNLNLLEHLYSTGLNWFGSCNELNASYSADGYSRMVCSQNKFGVVVTTFGVGELSAINGISGSFAEYVPVLHIVGTTSTEVKQTNANIHHLIPNKLGNKSNHYVYEEMATSVSCKVESLTDLDHAAIKIDNLIKEILITKRPGYLYIPCNLADQMINFNNDSFKTTSSFKLSNLIPSVNEELAIVTDSILQKIYNCKNPCILGDILTDRFCQVENLHKLVNITKFPNFSTFMGKSILNETNKTYSGEYNGLESSPETYEFVKSCDLIIHVGDYYTETNSGHDTIYKGIDTNKLILMNQNRVQIDSISYDVNFIHLLPNLLDKLNTLRIPKPTQTPSSFKINPVPSNANISQTDLLEKLQSFIEPNDTIVVETCSLMFGLPDLRLPKGTKVIGQHFYMSIGMGLPCSFGVGVALAEQKKRGRGRGTQAEKEGRLILIEGDGSAQMTIQELSNFNRSNEHVIKPIVLLLNNSGYTVERLIKGPERSYNDIRPSWNWSGSLLDTFGFQNHKSMKCQTIDDLNTFFENENDGFGNEISLCEVILDRLDVPWRFKYMCGTPQK
ncbi:hypothetical protein CANARDRAFT_8043 [[Candida] arabinofermentans NRRL YB-2248]|uniref:Pyruvate decarboxylase n=1 Tax=[Candida] arabinofermentans NRRL YB-2248 TaxID=983967 RepID=A0A1E4SZI1_9ASCO|nr:hypothetical protein CANARDRAFT_8043 [[Candida] arabinofermentans NRRL YB-2248]